MTEEEISLYLQGRAKRDGNPKRALTVGFGKGNYGQASTAIIEVTGSPNKGMAIIRLSAGSFCDWQSGAVPVGSLNVWVMTCQNGHDVFKALPEEGPLSAALAKFAASKLVD